jgi:stringent starvation protein B
MTASSTRPYMIRAIYEWCNDNGFTPYIAVLVDERCVVPQEHVRAGEIVLNLSVSATHNLTLSNDLVHFQARFSGVVRELSIPVENITAIYARENGHGMAFDVAKPLAEHPTGPQSLAPVELEPARSIVAPISKPERRISPMLGTAPAASPTPGTVQKTASISSLPAPRPKAVATRVSTVPAEKNTASKEPKRSAPGAVPGAVPAAEVTVTTPLDNGSDPTDEPSGPAQRGSGRNATRGRAKLTRIK